MTEASDVVIVGGGVIGLAIAWRCAQRGVRVAVVDAEPGSGASTTAAGMLAPVNELTYGEEALLRLNLASADRYPSFVAELEAFTGLDVGYRPSATLTMAWDAADFAALRDLSSLHASLGVDSEVLTGREARRREPGLAAGLPGGLFVASDHQIDNRALHLALLSAVERAGGRLVRQAAAEILVGQDRVIGVRLEDGSVIDVGRIVLAAGAASGTLAGLPAWARPPVRPVKGQTLRLRTRSGAPELVSHVVRGNVKGSPVYLVPRRNGELVVGASSEEAGFDRQPRAGAIYELLRDASALVPGVSELEWVEVSTGLRPGTRDNAPLIGRSGLAGLLVATGHYRNGVLLTPLTADVITALLHNETPPLDMSPFDPNRP